MRSFVLVNDPADKHYGSANDHDKAIDTFQKGKAVMDKLAASMPDNARWKQGQEWFAGQVAALMK